jgi:hypothetical protein
MSHFTITPSLLGSGEKCWQQAYYAYVEKIRIPPGIAQTLGTEIHRVILEEDQASRIAGQGLLPFENLKESFATHFQASLNEIDPFDTEMLELGGVTAAYANKQKQGFAMLDKYNEDRTVLQSKAVEQSFEVEMADTVMSGRFDSLDSDRQTTDLKTKDASKPRSRLPKRESDQESVQFQSYAAVNAKLSGVPDQIVRPLHFITKGPKAWIDKWELPFGETSHDVLEEKVFRAHKIIQAGAFYPVSKASAAGWVCSEKFCGYWKPRPDLGFAGCPFGQRARVSVSVEAEEE